ncbi:MAG: hypothetical protein ABI899_13070 [Actinomycetota bacterium]
MGANTKPFYRRWWFRAPSVLMVLIVFGAANNFGDPSTASPPSTGNQVAGAPAQRMDKGWLLDSSGFPGPGIGDRDFGGTARITNSNKTTASASFTITLLVNGTTVASLAGFAHNVPAGRTVTVKLTSQDEYQHGPYTLDFQTDASYH